MMLAIPGQLLSNGVIFLLTSEQTVVKKGKIFSSTNMNI